MRWMLSAPLAASLLAFGCSTGPVVTRDPSVALEVRVDELVRDRGGTALVYREILTETSCDRLLRVSANYESLRADPATSNEKLDVFASYSTLAGERWIELGC